MLIIIFHNIFVYLQGDGMMRENQICDFVKEI